MKKLLVLLLGLGVVSAANAAVIDIRIASLDGVAITPTNEITITASQTIDLQVVFIAPATEALFNIGVLINGVRQGDATLSVAGVTFDPALDPSLNATAGNRISIPANITTGYGPVGTVEPKAVVSNITIHCDLAPSADLIVTLSDYLDNPTLVVTPADGALANYTFGAGVIIHQIPEPMTLMLLGLGSLFLARRKK